MGRSCELWVGGEKRVIKYGMAGIQMVENIRFFIFIFFFLSLFLSFFFRQDIRQVPQHIQLHTLSVLIANPNVCKI